jgi:hypothetical protein
MNNLNNINNNEPEGLNPDLNKPGNENPFRTDADYFENFAEKIKGKVEEYEELRIEAPLLSSIPKYNPFEIPVGYFDELPTIIQQKCINTKTDISLPAWFKMLFRPTFAIPVICVILIAFAGIHYFSKTEAPETLFTEELSIDEQLQDIDETTLIDALADASVNETEADPEEETIKEYLMDNNIDDLNLNNEL